MKNLNTIKNMKEKRRGKMGSATLILLTIVIVVLASHFVVAINEFDDYKPYLHNPSVGDVPKLQTFGEYKTELYPGAGTYTYNIEVPLGVGGLQPFISVDYNSQSAIQRAGILGAGWSLTENSIIRNVNFTIDDTSDDYFILSINNARYKVLYNGSAFNTEINLHQFRIENLSNSGEMYWIVTTTDGTQYRFGYNNDSRLESNTGRNYDLKWSLDQIEDVHENKISYFYLEDPFAEDEGAVYLSNITYNNDGLRLVSFGYESSVRPDRRLVYEQGNKLEESRRLQNISVYFNNSLVRKYEFGYLNLNSEKSLTSLANITYFGSDGSSVLNTIDLAYYQTEQGFDNSTGKWEVPETFAFSSTTATKLDFGVRLIDVNNDGFPDLVKAKSGESHATRLNNKVGGWDTSSLFMIPSGIEIADSNSVDQGVRFADVNRDGLIDILRAKSGSSKLVYLNNGTGWYDTSTNWSIPLDFIDSDSKDLGVELVDLNGDGRIDILRAQEPSTKAVYLNNGTGWESSTDWNTPDYFTTSNNKDTGLRLLDLNNDGLPDLLKGGEPGSAWINNGTGWESYSQYAPDLEFVDNDNSRPDLGVRFIEINGDGLVDILQNFLSNVTVINQTCVEQNGTNCTSYNITSGTDVKINNGTGWTFSEGWLSPEKFTDEGFNIGRRIADINGDGYADIIRAYQASPYQNVTHIKNGTSAFLLKKITNAYGGITEIVYSKSTENENSDDLGFNIWVVENTTLNNSLTGNFSFGSDYSYSYQDGKFDHNSLEFRGFGNVNETLPDNSTVSHFFHQDDVLKGREYQTSVYDNNGSLIRETLNAFSHDSDNMISLDYSSLYIYDGNPSAFVSNTSFAYDFYGNVKQINNSGDTSTSGDEKYEVFDYVYNTTNFVVDKPANYTLFASDGSTIVRRDLYFYDGLSAGITIGDLTKLTKFNNGQNPNTLYAYDSFGNIIKETQPLGYNTTFTYDSTGTFRIVQTNELGHVVNYDYDFRTGNILEEVRDGLNKSFEYDVFGRIKKEIISPDSSTYPTKNYTYDLNGSSPEMIKVETKGNETDYSEDIFVYDGFGNLIQQRTKFNPSIQIVKNYFYDNKYRISSEQNPYFDTYSSTLSTPLSEEIIAYDYDALNRVVNLTKQDGNLTRVVFNKSVVSQYDEKNNRIDYILDTYGRIKNVLEYVTNSSGQDEIYTTSYSYNSADNLINITDTDENEFIFEYDLLGRRTSMDDPNMNPWNYNYDLNGNLINQTDGRGTVTLLVYDELNRLTQKYSLGGSTNVTFTYDDDINGTLSNITLNAQYSNPIYYRYSYDSRLRINSENISINLKSTPSQREWINSSIIYDSQDRILNMYMPKDNLSYGYNPIGKIENINGFLDSVNYNAFGKVENKTYANNLVTTIDYDVLGRVSSLQIENVQNLSYSYDSIGNVQNMVDTENSKEYSMQYDNLSRLTETNISGSSDTYDNYTYVYDAKGNILSSIYNQDNFLNPSSGEKITIVTNYTYTDLAHAPTGKVVDRPVYINVTACGTLEFSDTIYLVQSDIAVNGTCFFVNADNVTLDGQGHTVAGNNSQNIYGVSVVEKDDFVIKNITLGDFDTGIYFENSASGEYITILDVHSISNVGDGIWIFDGSGKHILHNVNASYNSINGITFFGTTAVRRGDLINITANENFGDGIALSPFSSSGEDFDLLNIVTNDNIGDGVDIFGGRNTFIRNLIAEGNNGDGLELSDSSNSQVLDSNIESLNLLSTSSTGLLFLNVSYTGETVSSGHSLTRQWYFETQVNDSNGYLENANVSIYNISSTLINSELTNVNGSIGVENLTEYVRTGATKTYHTPHTIEVSKSGYATNTTIYNLSEVQNVFHPVVLGEALDYLSIDYTTETEADNTSFQRDWIYVNTTVNGSEEKIVFNLYNESVSKEGLVLWLALDENKTDLIDRSLNGNDAIVNDAVFTSGGKLNGAYDFDGVDDYIDAGNSNPLNLTGDLSVSAWVNSDNLTADSRRDVVTKGRINSFEWALATNSAKKPSFIVFNTDGNNFYTATGATILSEGTWYHLTGTVNSTGAYIFLNGVLEGTNSTSASGTRETDGNASVYVGARQTQGGDTRWNGTIDEVRIYNRSLSASEITELYNSRVVNSTTYTDQTREINWTGLEPNDYYYNVYASDSNGNQNITETRSINLFTLLDLHSFTQLYSTASTERTFGFFITNLNDTTMNNVTWKFNTGESNITSQFASNLSAGDSKYVVFEYNYSSGGSYTAIATAYGGDGSISDSESLGVTI